ncbi:5-formyltetrahydrofolate cyclo-ligase [Bifidobacterium platyrrhinorum]|uniref:5-formyltetrahydrofolate cyclo-ligase n=1 Tax=Bifidobacterium platyrrhinorum TaxID=2661628 RepID=A0A6L9ST65_9BIFI|nr:5-formyltetrahydrofolate cyclo-ligase [Bifidobacterium platyrrhinorum]NEG55013.1 5-formyltetrahydrofolate cyclo-ligase [Bifidobacterium platyrrhinorum]
MEAHTKRELRHAAIARRKTVPPSERERAGERLRGLLDEMLGAMAGAATVEESENGEATARDAETGETGAGIGTGTFADGPGTVAAYVSMGSEIELRPLLGALLESGRRVLVPMLGAGLDVGWGELHDMDELRAMDAGAGHHRPDEPEVGALDAHALGEASLILVPALAVDASGTRLGRGGGWYDRALEHRAPGAAVIAVCWPWEVRGRGEEPLPREAHDLPVDGVLTPDGLTMF